MIATHYQIDFSEHYLADYMAIRGIGFLGWNTRFRGFESSFLLDHALVDIGVGVRWLREVAGVDTVVLLGNSGGGSLMAAYQSQAVDPNVTPLAGMRPAAGLTELIPADGYVASAAHPGRPEVLTAWMDGAVVDENDPVATDPDLDLFDENNGPPFRRSSSSVPRRTGRAQPRHHRLGRGRTETGSRRRVFGPAVHRDANLGRSAHGRPDASSRPSVRPTCATPGVPVKANRSAHGIAAACTLRNWLGMWSLRHAQTRAEPHLARIDLPRAGDQRRGRHRASSRRTRSASTTRSPSTDKTQVSIDTDHYFTTPGARSRAGRYHRQVDSRNGGAESSRPFRARRQGPAISLLRRRNGSTSAGARRRRRRLLPRAARGRGDLARAAAAVRRRPARRAAAATGAQARRRGEHHRRRRPRPDAVSRSPTCPAPTRRRWPRARCC